MQRSLASTARAMQSNSVATELHNLKPRAAKVALGCPVDTTTGNDADPVQPSSAFLAAIEQAWLLLNYKQEWIADRIGIDKGRLSKAIRQRESKVFDVRWLERMPTEFWPAFLKIVSVNFGVAMESHADIYLRANLKQLEGIRETLEQIARVSE